MKTENQNDDVYGAHFHGDKASGERNLEIAVSSYDRFNSALVAAIVLFGFLVALMLAVFLTSFENVASNNGGIILPPTDPGTNTVTDNYDILEPGPQDLPVEETLQFMTALESVKDTRSSVLAVIRTQSGDARESSGGKDGRGGRGVTPVPGPTPIPAHKRWEIGYECEDIETYARQIDYFDLTLGAVSLDTNEISLIRHVSTMAEVNRSDRRELSVTLRFEHKQNRMRRWDAVLASRAGVELDRTVMVQFYPESAQEKMLAAEAEFLQTAGRSIEDVRRTVLKVEKDGDAFLFRVTDMIFRN